MRILFLDHDGVICFGKDFDKKAVKVLNQIIEKSDCEIIVNSK